MIALPRLLLVDDEKPLLGVMERYLARLGYAVDCARNAAGAWSRFEADSAGYRVAVIDVTLPDEPGDSLARRMLARAPELRVVLMSGYPVDTSNLPPGTVFLQKPFSPKDLAAALGRGGGK